jgi:sensor histidine kinase YesM
MKITATEKKVLLYSSIFISLSVNINMLFKLIDTDELRWGVPWVFNLGELIYQLSYQLFFCLFLGFLNLKYFFDIRGNANMRIEKFILVNLLLFFVLLIIGMTTQAAFFDNAPNRRLFSAGYFFRFLISRGLVGILIRILLLRRKEKMKDSENQQLRIAYYNAQLTNLRAQINPHFFFNALSSVSAFIRTEPVKAQDYIAHLSKVFRYSLSHNHEQMVDIQKELRFLRSNIELLEMRFEDAIVVSIDIPNTLQKKVPHMSLQPLLENAVKHNGASVIEPLYIELKICEDTLVFRNSLREPTYKEPSTGIGLLNLNQRYKLLVGKEIEILKSMDHFTVKLPLI